MSMDSFKNQSDFESGFNNIGNLGIGNDFLLAEIDCYRNNGYSDDEILIMLMEQNYYSGVEDKVKSKKFTYNISGFKK